MAELHFDTDQGRDTASKLEAASDDIEGMLKTARSSVEGLVGSAWKAPGANQFEEAFQGWAEKVSAQVQDLQALKQKLTQEIEEWERIAANA